MTTRNRGGARDHKSKGNEEYDCDTYYGDENIYENEKQQLVSRISNLESRISNLESRNKAVECKNTALIVSMIVLLIVTLTIMTISIVHQLNIEQLNTETMEQSQISSRSSIFSVSEDWKVSE